MQLPQLIGIHSPSRQSGKSTVANVLTIGHGYRLAKFAGGLYAMFRGLAEYVGMPASVIIDATEGHLKEAHLAELGGLSFREFAEGVGTKWGREMYSPHLWVNIARISIVRRLAQGERIVVDDVRFPNEGDVIRDLGGVVVKVVRPTFNGGRLPTLPSEGHMEQFSFDYIFANDGSVEQLAGKVRTWLTYDAGQRMTATEVLRRVNEDQVAAWTGSPASSRS